MAKKKSKPEKKPAKRSSRPRKGKKENLDSEAAKAAAGISRIRKEILENEAELGRKLAEKISVENELNSLLRKKFSDQRALLSAVKRASSVKQESLRKELASLEDLDRIFEAKRTRLSKAKKRHNALKRQLAALEKHVGVWG